MYYVNLKPWNNLKEMILSWWRDSSHIWSVNKEFFPRNATKEKEENLSYSHSSNVTNRLLWYFQFSFLCMNELMNIQQTLYKHHVSK